MDNYSRPLNDELRKETKLCYIHICEVKCEACKACNRFIDDSLQSNLKWTTKCSKIYFIHLYYIILVIFLVLTLFN